MHIILEIGDDSEQTSMATSLYHGPRVATVVLLLPANGDCHYRYTGRSVTVVAR